MKSNGFESALQALASALEAAGSSSSASHLRDFAKAFAASPTVTLGKKLEHFFGLSLPTETGHPSLGDLAKFVGPISSIVNLTGNATTKAECEGVQKFLRDHATTTLNKFLEV